jgi:hypothetical protein
MFGRGNWAILGLNKDSLEEFKANLEDQRLMLAVSQCAASAITRHIKIDAIGINPFSAPRLDEAETLDLELEGELARYAASDADTRANTSLPEAMLAKDNFGSGEPSFQVHPSLPWYGLWAVSNEWKDVSDLASIKEQHSYEALERPYKFLKAVDKKSVDHDIRGVTAAMRKQFPVLLDFHEGRVYVENSGKKTLHVLQGVLKQLGVETFPVAWTFNRANWPAMILQKLHADTQYASDFQKRADEATRFRPKEIVKLDDSELESVVAHFFSMTQLPNELWVGLSTPAQIRLHATSAPIVAKAATSATTLLGMKEEAHVLSGSLTFQERITFTSKKGEERTFRKEVLSLDLNDQINLTDAGAAMLRGFDIPAFRKDIQREIKHSKQVPSIEEFWSTWLHQMSNAVRTVEASFRDILDLNGDEKAGIVPMQVTPAEEPAELEVA